MGSTLQSPIIFFRLGPQCPADIIGFLTRVGEIEHSGDPSYVVEEHAHIPEANYSPLSIAKCRNCGVSPYPRGC